ncbi:MAG: alpha-2-macroglobulin family protein [Candidatus Obscuribacterales bacterium]
MASNTESGKAIGGGNVTLIPSNLAKRTDANGLAKFQISESQTVVRFRDGIIDTFLPAADRWNASPQTGVYLWYHKTDRNLYRPGDTIHVKGMIRLLDWESANERTKLARGTKIRYTIRAENLDYKDVCELDSDGSFTFSYKLPLDMELGPCQIQFETGEDFNISNRTSTLPFNVQEFRRPEFEVTLNSNKQSMVIGDVAAVKASACYRSGASFPNGKVRWTVRSMMGNFSFQPTDRNLYGYFFGNGFKRRGRWPGRIGEHSSYNHGGHRVNLDFLQNNATATLDGTTDAHGDDVLLLSCKSLAEPEPTSLLIESTVQDLNRQSWSQRSNVLVHPADLYVGLKIAKQEFDLTEEKSIKLIVADLRSVLKADVPIDVELTYSKQIVDGSETKSVNEKVMQKLVNSDGSTGIDIPVPASQPGTYWITARVRDKKGRLNKTVYPFYVMSEEESKERKFNEKLQSYNKAPEPIVISVSADKSFYHVGDIATLKVTGDVPNGHGFVYLQNNRILDVIPFSLVNNFATVSVAVKESFFPRCTVSVRYFAPHSSGVRPIVCSASDLSVPMEELDLKVKVESEKTEYQPGRNAAIKISVQDVGGPVSNAQVAVAVVDEAIFALNQFAWENPIRAMANWYCGAPETADSSGYRRFEPEPELTPYRLEQLKSLPLALFDELYGPEVSYKKLSSVDKYTFFPDVSRDLNLFQVEPTVIDERHYTSGRSERHQATSPANQVVAVRSDLNPLAYFNPSVHTGLDGCASVRFKLPDNLTKYRVMVVASAGSKEFGSGATTFKTNMPLMVTPSLPRFLNYTDKCNLCLLVHNKTDKAVDSEVVVRARDLLLDDHKVPVDNPQIDIAGRRVQVPPQGRVEIRIPAIACEQSGQAVIQATALAGNFADSNELVIPLQPPVTTEAFATTGYVDGSPVVERIDMPPALVPEVGGLSVTTSSTAMQNLVGAAIYLQDYPFDCSEQLSSRILGFAALENLLSKFPDASELKPAAIRKLLERDVAELLKRQNSNGSFGLWKKQDRTDSPFVSAQCAKALWLASRQGLTVDEAKLNSARLYLKEIKKHLPRSIRRAANVALRAQALNIRMQMGDPDPAEARRVIAAALAEEQKKEEHDGESDPFNLVDIQEKLYRSMSLESMAWLWPVLASGVHTKDEAAAVRNVLFSHLSQTTANAEFQDELYGDEAYFLYYSENRLTAVALESLIHAEPKNVLIPKLVKELLQSRVNGRWRNTQENAHALTALSQYFNAFESEVPNFISQLWLGADVDAIYSEEKFVGRSMNSRQLKIPMSFLIAQPKGDTLTLGKSGGGRLYYRLELKYAQKNLKLAPVARGFEVSRTFRSVDQETDLSVASDGFMRIKPGAMVRVKLKLTVPGTRHHVALVDSLPAGFEIVDTALNGNRIILPEYPTQAERYRYTQWMDHTNLRDNRVELFASKLERGDYEYSYLVRATQLGSFIVPPCKVEEMYNPETFGRTQTDFLAID